MNTNIKDVKYIAEQLEEMGIATINEINLVTAINGYNIDTINDIIYVRTGCRDFDQLLEECAE